MKQRGRKSAASHDITVIDGGVGAPPEPPGDLNSDQMDIWNAIVRTEPAGFFNTDAVRSLLADYCRHREASETLSRVLGEFDPEWTKAPDGLRRYDTLLRLRDRESKAVMRCATKLRITNQSRYTPQAAGTSARNKSKVARPWEA